MARVHGASLAVPAGTRPATWMGTPFSNSTSSGSSDAARSRFNATKMAVTVGAGGATYVKPLVRVPVPLVVVTTTLTAPAACDGVTAVIVVGLTTTTEFAAVPPSVTVAPARKLVPWVLGRRW